MPKLYKRVALVGVDNSKWIIDSGADVSVINSLKGLDPSTFRPSSMVLASAGGQKTKAAKEGSIRLRFANVEGQEIFLKLRRVFYVPQMREQLLSVKDLIRDNNIRVNFDGEGVRVTTSDGARLRLAGADYEAYPASSGTPTHTAALWQGASSEESSDLWSESSEESSDDNAPVLLGLLASEHVHERRAVLRHLDEVDWSSTPPFRFRRALEQMAKRDADADVAAHAAAIVSVMPAASAQKTPRTMTPAVVDEDDDDDEEGAADAEDAPWSALRPVARMTIILAQIPPSLRSALARHVDVLVRSSGSTTAHTGERLFKYVYAVGVSTDPEHRGFHVTLMIGGAKHRLGIVDSSEVGALLVAACLVDARLLREHGAFRWLVWCCAEWNLSGTQARADAWCAHMAEALARPVAASRETRGRKSAATGVRAAVSLPGMVFGGDVYAARRIDAMATSA